MIKSGCFTCRASLDHSHTDTAESVFITLTVVSITAFCWLQFCLMKQCSNICVFLCLGRLPCTPHHTWSLEWGECATLRLKQMFVFNVLLIKLDSPCLCSLIILRVWWLIRAHGLTCRVLNPVLFVSQETHAIRESDRLQDIWAQQKTTELDRGGEPFALHIHLMYTA